MWGFRAFVKPRGQALSCDGLLRLAELVVISVRRPSRSKTECAPRRTDRLLINV